MNCCDGHRIRYHIGTKTVNGKVADVYQVYYAHDHTCVNVMYDTLDSLPLDTEYSKLVGNRW